MVRTDRTPCPISVKLTTHAAERMIERRVDLADLLHRVRGLPIYQWRRHGIVAVFNPRRRVVKVITVWNPDVPYDPSTDLGDRVGRRVLCNGWDFRRLGHS